MGWPTLLAAAWLTAVWLTPVITGHADPPVPGGPIPNRYEQQAIERGEALGIGTARLSGPQRVTVNSFHSWQLTFQAGAAGIAPGGGIRVAMRHLPCWSLPQTDQPTAAGFFSATASSGQPLDIRCPTIRQLMTQYFAWQQLVQIRLPEQGLKQGQTLELRYGDRRGGSPGMRVQPFDESCFVFKIYVDALGTGDYLPLGRNPAIRIVADTAVRLSIVAPSDAVSGEPTWCLVRAEDLYGNPAVSYRGTVVLQDPGQPDLRFAHTFQPADRGVFRFASVRFARRGTHRLTASDGRLRTSGNPIRVAQGRPDRLLLWGDLHGHTLFSDGRGTVEEFYDFAQRVAGLDFCAVTDHAFEVLDEMWEHSKQVTNRYYQPGQFVTFQAYEWSGITPLGGDHNCYFLDEYPPLLRSTLMYDARNLQMYHGQTPKQEQITDVFHELRRRLRDRNVFCIPHYGGRRGNPRWHDPKVQRMIEVFSEHRRSEDWAQTFLNQGRRLGIMASTDGHFGNPGYGYLKPTYDWVHQEIGMAAVAVFAQRRTRESVFHALYDRHVYATSGDRIILDFRVDGHRMGSEISSDDHPTLQVDVVGTAKIERVEFKRDGQVVHTVEPESMDCRHRWQDTSRAAGQSVYYYVRVVQTNGEEAISSPVWVD